MQVTWRLSCPFPLLPTSLGQHKELQGGINKALKIPSSFFILFSGEIACQTILEAE